MCSKIEITTKIYGFYENKTIDQTLYIYISKVVPINKCTTVCIDNFKNISTDSSIQVSVCRGSYDGYVKHKRHDPVCDPWDSFDIK